MICLYLLQGIALGRSTRAQTTTGRSLPVGWVNSQPECAKPHSWMSAARPRAPYQEKRGSPPEAGLTQGFGGVGEN